MLVQPTSGTIPPRFEADLISAPPATPTFVTTPHKEFLGGHPEAFDIRSVLPNITNDELRATIFVHPRSYDRSIAMGQLATRGRHVEFLYALSDPSWCVRQDAAIFIAKSIVDEVIPVEILIKNFESPVVPTVDPRTDGELREAKVCRVVARHACFRALQYLNERLAGTKAVEAVSAYVARQSKLLDLKPLPPDFVLPLDTDPPANPLGIAKAPLARLLRNAALFHELIDRLHYIKLRREPISTTQERVYSLEERSFGPIIREIRRIVAPYPEARAAILPAALQENVFHDDLL